MQSAAPPSRRPRGWSLRVGVLAGIDVYVHLTFLLLLLWLGGAELKRSGSATAAAGAVTFVVGVFACVVLHELGHALTARRYGIATRDITLYPIGGVASLERLPEDPRQELAVAVAGPLVNVGIAALLAGLLVAWPALGGPPLGNVGPAAMDGGPILPRLLWANLALAAFNLLPAFPMDGGRALRALMTKRLGRTRATRRSAQIGQMMALGFGVVGVLGAPMLVLLAIFVWVAAEHEARAVEVDDALRGLTVAGAMETRFDVLRPGDALAHARDLVLRGPQVDFPVVDADGRYAGLLGRDELLRGLRSAGDDAAVASAARTDLPSAAPDEPLRAALSRLGTQPWRTVPVLDAAGRLLGLLSSENVAELVMFHEVAARSRRPPGAAARA